MSQYYIAVVKTITYIDKETGQVVLIQAVNDTPTAVAKKKKRKTVAKKKGN